MDKQKVIKKLNELMNFELLGVMKYTHYSFSVFGQRRLAVIGFLHEQANESLMHATKIGEKITALGGKPVVETNTRISKSFKTIEDILSDSLDHEREALEAYKRLLKDVEDDVVMDGFVRDFVVEESSHQEEVEKMLREM